MAFLAYLRHLTGFVAILTALSPILSISSKTMPEAAPNTTYTELREAASNKNTKKRVAQKSAETIDTYYSSQLKKLGIALRPGTEHNPNSKSTPTSSSKCKSIVYKTLIKLPYSHRQQLNELTLFYAKTGRRGLGGDGAIILRCLNVTDDELSSVLVHEMGHLVDGGFLFGFDQLNQSGFYDFETPVLADDPSAAFYRISWLNNKIMQPDSTELDFVSMYAMTDPFEDFAETYAYYRLHSPEFRALAEFNSALKQKYEFMKAYVFFGNEYGTEKNQETDINVLARNYDVTILPITQ
ncbi:hypothetical protein HZC21_05360 [Candidatus Peregrinibacteria bacterium]|nr:hypothetical protein [Candidatus Peregrinibacteria bacterium]